MRRIQACSLAVVLTGCLDSPRTLADLRSEPSVSVSIDTTVRCLKDTWCLPILDDQYLVLVLELHVDLGDLKAAELPTATANGAGGKTSDRVDSPWFDYEWIIDSTAPAWSITLADSSDRWTVDIAQTTPRTTDLQLVPRPDAPPVIHAGDPLRVTITPAPDQMTAQASFMATSDPVSFQLSTKAGTLVYGAGVLAGEVPAVTPTRGTLRIEGKTPRAISCDGPPSCSTQLEDGFTIEQLVDVQ
jgi:hypothetical protein